jgi:succinyl-diaminopimelate desuccinylase
MPDELTRGAVFDLTYALIARQSVTPADAGCQELLATRLEPLGFTIEQIDHGGVSNLWAVRGGQGPHLMFAGHTDVVPPGPAEEWSTPPFTPTVIDGFLYGRGASDMKSSLAAMVVAVENTLADNPELTGTLSFLITSDEEGEALHGTQHVIRVLNERGICPDYCIVGEPSSSEQLGDVVRCGRRGSINGDLTIRGIQGHVAYPEDARNPIHQAFAALAELTTRQWDEGNEYYPPTSLQISNIHAGTGATNVIPGSLSVQFNLRFNTEQTSEGLQRTIEAMLHRHGLEFELDWYLSGQPFLTRTGHLTNAVTAAIRAETGMTTELSTSGGTSDGRFISPWGMPGSHQVEVVELGPNNATIHKIDERIALAELEPLARIYRRVIELTLPS